MSDKKDIGSVFKNAMDGYSDTPDDVWPGVASGLKRHRRKRILVVLFLILGISVIGLLTFKSLNPEIETPQELREMAPQIPEDTNNPALNDSLRNPSKLLKNPDTQTGENDSVLPKEKEQQNNSDNKLPSKQDIKKQNKEKIFKNDLIEKHRNLRTTRLLAATLEPFDSLDLNTGEVALAVPTLSEEIDLEETQKTRVSWSLSAFTSLDHYNAFGRQTSERNTLNSGVHLYFYGTDRLSIRAGYKELNLQYNYVTSDSNLLKQEVRYIEIPLEGRYFFNDNKLKFSMIVGGSYLFLQESTRTDFANDITQDNRNTFRNQIFSLNGGLGIHYDIASRWRVNLESSMKYHPFPYARSQNNNPYNLSFSAGIEYRFNL